MAKWGPSTHESSDSLSSSPRSIADSSIAKAAPTATPILLARLLELATEYDRSGLTSFNAVGLTSANPVGDSGIYLLRTCGLRAMSSPIPGVGLGGIVPRTENTALGGLVLGTESTALGGLEPRTGKQCLGWARAPRPAPKALPWVGSCPALNLLSWMGSTSPLPIFTIFARTGHV